jgi:Raf kinase inhibitor-like YbhB/YbcL family protein
MTCVRLARERLPRRSGSFIAAGAVVALAALAACTRGDASAARIPATEGPMTLALTSSAFTAGSSIPARFTCDGKDVSPPLAWSGAPNGTRSFALIVDDPDAPDPKAPKMTWVHWVLYDIPASAGALAEGVAPRDLPAGTREGKNDWKRTGYGGPCPPVGRHRYFFKLYALDAALGDLAQPTKARLEKEMRPHILAHAELIATYEHPR